MALEKDWLFRTDDYICDVRTVGVCVQGNRILVQRDRDGTEYALPGGHIRVGETLEEGLIREYKEETGADIRVLRMLWTEECFWQWQGKQAHDLAFYYLIELVGSLDIPDSGEFVSHKDNCDVVLGWMGLEQIREITIYPEFLKSQIGDLEGPIQHFLSK